MISTIPVPVLYSFQKLYQALLFSVGGQGGGWWPLSFSNMAMGRAAGLGGHLPYGFKALGRIVFPEALRTAMQSLRVQRASQ